jgi:hypothetical protein
MVKVVCTCILYSLTWLLSFCPCPERLYHIEGTFTMSWKTFIKCRDNFTTSRYTFTMFMNMVIMSINTFTMLWGTVTMFRENYTCHWEHLSCPRWLAACPWILLPCLETLLSCREKLVPYNLTMYWDTLFCPGQLYYVLVYSYHVQSEFTIQ